VEIVMTAVLEKNHPKYPRRNVAEDRAWRRLYRDAADPVIAAELVRHLDDDARRLHLALYLRCRRTLRKQAARRSACGWIVALYTRAWRRVARRLRLLRSADAHVAGTLTKAAQDTQRAEPRAALTTDLTRHGLRAIEGAAERANPVQLRAYLSCLRINRLTLGGDERAAAEGLMLKLERLLQEQSIEPLSADAARVIACDPLVEAIQRGLQPRASQVARPRS